MNCLKLFLFLLLVNGIRAQTQSKIQNAKNSVRCMKDEHCAMIMGMAAKCKDSVCVCDNEELCKTHTSNARYKSNIIGEQCADDTNCNIQFALCSESFCVCHQDRVASNDGRKCLDVSGGLGQKCIEDAQCIKKIQGSVCRNNICVCDNYHHQVQNSSECFAKVGLGQACTHQVQCNHISRANCGLMFCQCDAGFIQSASRNKCLPVATKPLDKCEEVEQCRKLYGQGGVCMYGRCECDSVHRVANSTACPTRLKQICENDDECKSYIDDPTMHCDMERCECLHPYFEQNGICSGSEDITGTSIILAFCLLLHFKFLKFIY